MTSDERRLLSRQLILDKVLRDSKDELGRYEYIALGNRDNWCASVHSEWLQTWRDMVGSKKDLIMYEIGARIILANPDHVHHECKLSKLT